MDVAAVTVDVAEAKIGSVLAEDVIANAGVPIIAKDTALTREHLEVLQAFEVERVSLKAREIASAEGEQSTERSAPARSGKAREFSALYLEAVRSYKKEFASWEGARKVDVAGVRAWSLPVLQAVLEDRSVLRELLKCYLNTEEYAAHHPIAVGMLAAGIAQKLDYPDGTIFQIGIAGILMDAGMAKIPSRIRGKSTPLTAEEHSQLKKHTLFSYQLIKDTPLLKNEVKSAILDHHERLDGSGYPRRVRLGTDSQIAQILAVSDAFHAMVSKRSYREARSVFEALETLHIEEFGKFDPAVYTALLRSVGTLPVSSRVELSDGQKAEVLFVNPNAPLRPIVRLEKTGAILDLEAERKLSINCLL